MDFLKGIDAIKADPTNGSGLPPVHAWNPPFCGDIDMRIARDGTWFYEGTPIGRPALVRLFSTILRFDEDGKYYLVTPVEKVGIQVDDAPFVGVRIDRQDGEHGAEIMVTTNVGDTMVIDRALPLRVTLAPRTQEPSPYVLVRHNLEALLSRPAFYELVALS
ncbi:MAG: DUF1285 domain-containing protein, partial [Pseudomonadota bacterium]